MEARENLKYPCSISRGTWAVWRRENRSCRGNIHAGGGGCSPSQQVTAEMENNKLRPILWGIVYQNNNRCK